MLNVSYDFKNEIRNGNRKYIVDAKITLVDGTILNIGNSNIWNGGLTFDEATSGDNSFDVGSTIMSSLTLVLDNLTDQYNGYDFYDAVIELKFGLLLPSGETEYIRKGFYTVIEPTFNGSLITLNCLDNMWKLETDFANVVLSTPITIGDMVSTICTYCNVSLASGEFNNSQYYIDVLPDKDMNCREVINYLAQLCCCYAKIDNNGALKLDWYKDVNNSSEINLNGGEFDHYSPYATGDTADGGNFTDWTSGDSYDGGDFSNTGNFYQIKGINSETVSTDLITITGVKVYAPKKYNQEQVATEGTDGYVITIKDNPFIKDLEMAEDIAVVLANKLVNYKIRKFSVSALNCVYVECGDCCIVTDHKGHMYTSVITSLTFSIGRYEKFKCGAESPQRANVVHYSEQEKTLVEVKKQTQDIVSAYDVAVKNMNTLACNTMGYFETIVDQDDGSRISYYHNKPTLAGSTIVYKMSADGFFVSEDGGQTYVSGFDSDGNAVLNILSAIGIKFDWAKGGTITLGGSNNGKGSLIVLDETENTELCKITNDTFTLQNTEYIPPTYPSSVDMLCTTSNIIVKSSANDEYTYNYTAYGEMYMTKDMVDNGFKIKVLFDEKYRGNLRITYTEPINRQSMGKWHYLDWGKGDSYYESGITITSQIYTPSITGESYRIYLFNGTATSDINISLGEITTDSAIVTGRPSITTYWIKDKTSGITYEYIWSNKAITIPYPGSKHTYEFGFKITNGTTFRQSSSSVYSTFYSWQEFEVSKPIKTITKTFYVDNKNEYLAEIEIEPEGIFDGIKVAGKDLSGNDEYAKYFLKNVSTDYGHISQIAIVKDGYSYHSKYVLPSEPGSGSRINFGNNTIQINRTKIKSDGYYIDDMKINKVVPIAIYHNTIQEDYSGKSYEYFTMPFDSRYMANASKIVVELNPFPYMFIDKIISTGQTFVTKEEENLYSDTNVLVENNRSSTIIGFDGMDTINGYVSNAEYSNDEVITTVIVAIKI